MCRTLLHIVQFNLMFPSDPGLPPGLICHTYMPLVSGVYAMNFTNMAEVPLTRWARSCLEPRDNQLQ